MFRRWAEGTLQSILGAVILALIPGVAVTYLAHVQSVWTKPLLLGLTAFALAAFIVLAIDAIRRLPPRRVIPNVKNIEICVRDWLNNFQYAVKKSPVETAYFRYLVTVDSGTKMFIGRPKGDFQDYVLIRSDLIPGPQDLEHIATLTTLQTAVIVGNIRLELARHHVGYLNISIPIKDAHIFKRIPIRETLTEHDFVAAIEEVEAAAHSVAFVFALEMVQAGKLIDPQRDQRALDFGG